MARGLERNSVGRRRQAALRGRSRSPSSMSRSSRSSSPNHSAGREKAVAAAAVAPPLPQPYMKQIKLHPSGCQQWSKQVVVGGGNYMAYASTLTTYVYDTRDFSLITILGGNDCNVHSLLWHPQHPHRLLVLSVDGIGAQWDVRAQDRVASYDIGSSPACSAWDAQDQMNLAVVSKSTNTVHLLENDVGRFTGGFRKAYIRRSSDPSLSASCAKWSLHERGLLAVGWTDGRVSFSGVSARGAKYKTTIVCPCEDQGGVVDLRYDPNGGGYALMAYVTGTVVLWDTAAHCVVTTFKNCTTGLVGVRWTAWAPGNFLALSSATGIARVFNISQQHPMRTVRLGETGSGLRDFHWLPPCAGDAEQHAGGNRGIGRRAICGFRDGSLTVANVAYGEEVSTAGVIASREGARGAILWASKAGHIETVFGCAHKPGDADTIATCSYGSNVKVWHVPTMDLKVSLTGQAGAIYSVAWSSDGEQLASSSGDGSVWIWDAESGKAQRRLALHSRAAHRVHWDPFHNNRVASAGADRSLMIFDDEGRVERVYVHPAPLFGCHWCPSHPHVIATGCQDGKVRVFDTSCSGGEPQYVLIGHTRRVFHVCWSPLIVGTLASGADDGNVLVWTLDGRALPRSDPAGACVQVRPKAVLRGHSSNVRPLHWNSEVPWLLVSGSWDGTVRAWDIRRGRSAEDTARADEERLEGARDPGHAHGACIAVMHDHVADVYGLSAAPSRPFQYVSVSRDTTIRQFTLEGVVSSIKAKAVLRASLSCGLGTLPQALMPDSPVRLCGNAAASLNTRLRTLECSEGSASLETWRKLFDFFGGSDGMDTLWETMRWVTTATKATDNRPRAVDGTNEGLMTEARTTSTGRVGTNKFFSPQTSPDLRKTPPGLMEVEEVVLHRDARIASKQALAVMLAKSPAFIVQDQRVGRRDRLERAVRLHVASGDLPSACEALVLLNKWERALALAPGAGLDYWAQLARRYVEVLLAGGDNRVRFQGNSADGHAVRGADACRLAAGLLASTGRPTEALDILPPGSDDALTLAVAVANGAYPPAATSGELSPRCSAAAATPMVAALHEGREARRNFAEGMQDAREHQPDSEDLAVRGDRDVGDGDKSGAVPFSQDVESAYMQESACPKSGPSAICRENMNTSLNGDSVHDYKRAELTPANMPSSVAPVPRAGHAASAAQRAYAEEALQSMTRAKAEAFFRTSQPALAAAAMLSTCDGTRETSAPAVSYLLRGDEPELAYAVARALRFPARELRPLVREVARKAEAWGDAALSAELLLDADDEDGCIEQERLDADACDLNNISETGGYWPIAMYGTAGAAGGRRGAMQLVSRCGSTATDTLSSQLSLRSTGSYLLDAMSAARRGTYVEAVQMFVLGGDLNQAAEVGLTFLRECLSAASMSTGHFRAALAVTRALGSSHGLKACLEAVRLAAVFAYASYMGALEAAARDYRPVVVPLLRNASTCVQRAERLTNQLQQNRRFIVADDEETKKAQAVDDPSADLGADCAERLCHRPESLSLFPSCMSPRALISAATWYMSAPHNARSRRTTSPRRGRGATADARRRPCNENSVPAEGETQTIRHLFACVKTASSRQQGYLPFSRHVHDKHPQAKGSCDGDQGSDHTTIVRPSCIRSDARHHQKSFAAGEIIVGGSRLPTGRRQRSRDARRSCRPIGDGSEHRETDATIDDFAFGAPLPDIGDQTWPLDVGANFVLEDGLTSIGLSEAVMWAKVNPFSPLNTGALILPF